MATRRTKVSLTSELNAFIDRRVRSGFYGSSSEVIRAGLRALAREEAGSSQKHFVEIMAALPHEPITREIEQEIEHIIRTERAAESRNPKK